MFLFYVNSILTMLLSAVTIYWIYNSGSIVFRVVLIVFGLMDFAIGFYISVMNRRYAQQKGIRRDLLWEVNTAASLLVVFASYFILNGAARHVFAAGLGFAILSNFGDVGIKIVNGLISKK